MSAPPPPPPPPPPLEIPGSAEPPAAEAAAPAEPVAPDAPGEAPAAAAAIPAVAIPAVAAGASGAWILSASPAGDAAAAPASTPFSVDRLRIEPTGSVVPPGAAVELVELSLTGVITQLEIRDNRKELAPEDAAALELIIAASPPLPANEGGAPRRMVDLIVRLQDLFGPAAGRYRAGDWQAPNLAVEYDVLQFRLPLPFSAGTRILLRNAGKNPCRVAGRASGQSFDLPAGTAFLRSQTARIAAGGDPREVVLFESHGRGQFAALVCSEPLTPEVLDGLRICFYRDGDERLQQIEEIPARDYFAAGAGDRAAQNGGSGRFTAPAHPQRFHASVPLPFAEYVKCTVAVVQPLPMEVAFTAFAYVEDRPIA
ncbi:MAG TPA: hypothetical protein VL860_00150 [Planctomycetota bacterium]|nr:hypothetical protein [Planctomycetota bacterium]